MEAPLSTASRSRAWSAARSQEEGGTERDSGVKGIGEKGRVEAVSIDGG